MGCRSVPTRGAVQQPCLASLLLGELSRTAASGDVLQGIASQNGSVPLIASPLSKVFAASRIAEAPLTPGYLHRKSI